MDAAAAAAIEADFNDAPAEDALRTKLAEAIDAARHRAAAQPFGKFRKVFTAPKNP